MTETFGTAKNGLQICTAAQEGGGTILLHSKYDPEKEGERFADSIQAEDEPSFIVVTGPCLSYCAPHIRKRFPRTALIAIQYSPAFRHRDGLWDRVIEYTTEAECADELFSAIQEENVGSTLFCSWKSSETAYVREYRGAWNAISAAVKKGRDVLGTRTYFSRRWAVNSVSFCVNVTRAALPVPGTMPVVLAAAGPSLEHTYPFMREHRENIFILSLAPALAPLLHAGIVPDACVSTDGGYWAKQHLLTLEQADVDVPLILAAESAVPLTLLQSVRAVPLRYGDGPEASLLDACSIPSVTGYRNGTSAGTAARFALRLTSGQVFACGLDLAPSASWNHARPNALDERAAWTANRLRPFSVMCAENIVSHGALDIYASWFGTWAGEAQGRFFRAGPVPHPIPGITDVPLEAVEKNVKGSFIRPSFRPANMPSEKERRMRIAKTLEEAARSIQEATVMEDIPPGIAETWLSAAALPQWIKLKRRARLNQTIIPEDIKEASVAFFSRLLKRIEKDVC